MIEFVGWADEKGEGQQRANEMRGVFVRGRMQQFRVNSEQRMLVMTDSQQEGGRSGHLVQAFHKSRQFRTKGV